MTATDELRRLLDERGVEYVLDYEYAEEYPPEQRVMWSSNIAGEDMTVTARDYCININDDGSADYCLDLEFHEVFTPEQAIAATLGVSDATGERQGDAGTCKLDDFADVPFSVDYEIEGYDMDSGRDYATLAECSACGAYIIVPPEYHHVLTCDGDEVYQPYRFCPNCGRRVE